MGSGKTTLGRAVSAAMGKDFIDLDIFIETRFRKTVKALFAEYGEERFREIERAVLHEVGEFEDVIVACGGGTPCHYDNIDFMNRSGITVELRASVSVLVERLTIPSAKQKRPIIAEKSDEELTAFVSGALAEREAYYSQAQIHFDADRLHTREQIAESAAALAAELSKAGERATNPGENLPD